MSTTHLTKALSLLLIVAVLNLPMGCNLAGTAQSDAATGPDGPLQPFQPERVPTKSFVDIGTSGDLFVGDSPYIRSLVDSVAAFLDVQEEIAYFALRDYQLAPECAVVLEGAVMSESGQEDSATVVSLAFRYLPDTTQQAAYLHVILSGDRHTLEPWVVSFVPRGADEGFELLEDGVWVDVLTPRLGPHPLAAGVKECIFTAFMSGCAGCAGGCAFTGPGWLGCTTICCTAVYVASVVACVIVAMLGS